MAKSRHWIAGAVKHPGIEKRRAKANGISTHERLERDANSSNPTLRGRGELGLRFEKGISKKPRSEKWYGAKGH